MSVSGSWINGYGSVMFLTQADGGSVTGVYTSTTGSSGAYWVAGFANPSDTGANGQALAFSILWRSFSGGTPDPSWHYASGMSGQALPLNAVTNGSTLSMIHDMVATVPFPALGITVPGSYIDKLAYVPYTGGQTSPGQWPPPFTPPSQPDPVDGNWNCVQEPGVSLSLAVQDETSGYVTGTMTTANGTVNVVGFTDTGAGATTPLQGLALSALLPDGVTVVALAGSLDLTTGGLTVSWLQSNGTTTGNAYLQTTVEGLNFVKAR